MDADQISSLCKALGESNRLKIVQMLSGREQCACVMLEKFNITQPTLSHHMKILCDCGLVSVRKDGKWIYYSLNRRTLEAFTDFIESLDCGGDHRCDGAACGCR